MGNEPPTKKGVNSIFDRALLHYFIPALHNHWLPDPKLEAKPNDLEVVTATNAGVCLDPRDYIYGVMSLFKDPDSCPVDYTLSDAEVFADFTVRCMLNDRNIAVLNPGRLATGVRNARSDLPTWCPDWSVAASPHSHHSAGGDGVRFDRGDQASRGWKASGTTEFVYSRPSRLTLTLRGFAVSRLKLCSDSTLDWPDIDDDEDCWWSDRSGSLRAFFERQGLQIDHKSKDMILRVFDRTLHPNNFEFRDGAIVSKESRLLLDEADRNDLISLLTPLYLAKADPELFVAAGFELDERVPPEDCDGIREQVSTSLWHCSGKMRLFFTEHGMMGSGYASIKEGDFVCLIYGSLVPQILRETSSGGQYFLVGECHIDGLMFGEGLEMGLPEQDFILV